MPYSRATTHREKVPPTSQSAHQPAPTVVPSQSRKAALESSPGQALAPLAYFAAPSPDLALARTGTNSLQQLVWGDGVLGRWGVGETGYCRKPRGTGSSWLSCFNCDRRLPPVASVDYSKPSQNLQQRAELHQTQKKYPQTPTKPKCNQTCSSSTKHQRN